MTAVTKREDGRGRRGRPSDAELDAAFAAAMASAGPSRISEAQLQTAIVTECKRLNLHVFAIGRSDRAQLSRVSATGRGWPDLFIASLRTGRLLARELKTESGETSAAQDAWLWMLSKSGVDVDVWRPADLESGLIRKQFEALG